MIFSIAARHCVGVPSKYNGMANIKRLSIRTFSMLKKNTVEVETKVNKIKGGSSANGMLNKSEQVRQFSTGGLLFKIENIRNIGKQNYSYFLCVCVCLSLDKNKGVRKNIRKHVLAHSRLRKKN